MGNNKNKKYGGLESLGGMVYSTNPDYKPAEEEEYSGEALKPDQQKLIVQKSIKGRGGKTVTLITGFQGSEDELKELGKMLKTKCGTGGSVKDGEILIQGDVRQKVYDTLKKEGYQARLSGG